ncbi:MAG: AAA family ATPase, partial [Pseudomonadota bacterium]|nr:AAA family ATPase [Pseudomonadota bacterium]
VLFDEIEKAHPDIFNILLQVLDDGHLTDGHGRKVDFRNTLILLTSNLGSGPLLALEDGAFVEQARDAVMEEVQAAFRPEFLNRLDSVLLFQRLSREHMSAIVDIQMAALQTRLVDREIRLNLTPDARSWLAYKGYDPHYGARPLKRVIQTHVQDKLAEALLQGKINSGETIDIVKTDVPDGLLIQANQQTLKQTGS